MRPEDPRVSLADLSAVGIRLRPAEAVTIVRELSAQVLRGIVPGVPSAHVIRLSLSGHVTVEGPVAAGRAVSRAATLLDSLLPPFDAPHAMRAPGALRLVLARALGTLDLPAYGSLEAFSEALERFSEPDAAATVRRLAGQWAQAASGSASEPEPVSPADSGRSYREADRGSAAAALAGTDRDSVTVSDIRRARRATGLPLVEISARSRIPVPLLRQLEWGYLHNWPSGQYGRTQLVRYARAGGLDAEIVVAAIWPLVVGAARSRADRRDAAGETLERGEAAAVQAAPPEAAAPPVVRREAVLPDDLPLRHVEPEPSLPRGRRPRWRMAAAAAVLAVAGAVAALTLQDTRSVLDPGELAGLLRGPVEPERGGAETATADSTVAGDKPGEAADGTEPGPDRTVEPGEPRALREPAPPPAGDPADDGPVATAGSPAPAARPAARIVTDADTAWSSALASEGSASFQDPEGAILRQASTEGGAILRITRVVDDGARNFHARPSPDGSRIAFDSDRDGERGVYIADADGANVRRVSGDGFAAIPSWAPDGRRLAFVRAEVERPRVWNLWLMDLESGDLRRLTDNPGGQPWGASWFPDGRRLAYSRGDRLAVLDVESGRERVHPSPRTGRAVRTPAVSPDGRRMIFQVEGDGAWLLNLEDGSTRKVLADPTADEYVWSPDGRRVAYHSRRSGEWGVWLVLSRQ